METLLSLYKDTCLDTSPCPCKCKESLSQDNPNEEQREFLQDVHLPVTFSILFVDQDTTTTALVESNKEFLFGVQRPSYGCLQDDEDNVAQTFDASAGDPNFFDASYTLAGSTGFCVWAGARFFLEALLTKPTIKSASTGKRLEYYQERIRQGNLCALELGAGVGMVGTVLAAAGAHVLITDLPTLVTHAVEPNLYLNSMPASATNCQDEPHPDLLPPQWLQQGLHNENINPHVHKIGKGWASAVPLDWTKPMDQQLVHAQYSNANVIVASDCIFLADLLPFFLDTVQTLFDSGGPTALLLSFQLRDKNIGSALFTTPDSVVLAMTAKGWSIVVLGYKSVVLVDGTKSQVALLEITPSRPS